jgi:hypothetical protein
MKIYIAAHLSLRDEVRNLYDLCRTHGHTITKDWTTHEAPLSHERDEKSHLVTQIAQEDIEGVRSAEVFIILSDGTG